MVITNFPVLYAGGANKRNLVTNAPEFWINGTGNADTGTPSVGTETRIRTPDHGIKIRPDTMYSIARYGEYGGKPYYVTVYQFDADNNPVSPPEELSWYEDNPYSFTSKPNADNCFIILRHYNNSAISPSEINSNVFVKMVEGVIGDDTSFVNRQLESRSNVKHGQAFSVYDQNGKEKVRIYGDSEGGNIRVCPPDDYPDTSWELDAYNENLRIYVRTGGKNIVPFCLKTDGSVDLPNSNKYYFAHGEIITSKEGAVRGYGVATIIVQPTRLAAICFSARITTAGNESKHDWGINASALKNLCDGLPDITPETGGVVVMVKEEKIDTTLNGYGGTMSARDEFWNPARKHTTDNTAIGAWYESIASADTRLIGVCFGVANSGK